MKVIGGVWVDESLISVPSQAEYLIVVEDVENKRRYVIPLYFRWRGGAFSISHLVTESDIENTGLKNVIIVPNDKNEQFEKIVSCFSDEDVMAENEIHKKLAPKYVELLKKNVKKYKDIEKAVLETDKEFSAYVYSLDICF